MKRRSFVALAGLGALATVRAPRASSVRNLRMVTSWPAGFPGLGTSAARVARSIEVASGGSLKIEVLPAGEAVGPFEVFDAVESGRADLYHSADYYQQAVSPAYNFFTAIPFGFTAEEMAGWILHRGGQRLWDELAAARNIKPLMCTSTGTQMGGWFTREIRRLADLRDLKIRMPGLGGEALARLGAVPVNVAGGLILEALQQGELDAAEWVGPWNDLAAGLHTAASHYYYPGFHEPGGMLTLGINLDVWQSFDPVLQAQISNAATAEYTRSLSEFNVENAAALTTLQSRHGVVPKRFNDEILIAVRAAVDDVVAEQADADELTARVHESFIAARADALRWAEVSLDAYTRARRLGNAAESR